MVLRNKILTLGFFLIHMQCFTAASARSSLPRQIERLEDRQALQRLSILTSYRTHPLFASSNDVSAIAEDIRFIKLCDLSSVANHYQQALIQALDQNNTQELYRLLKQGHGQPGFSKIDVWFFIDESFVARLLEYPDDRIKEAMSTVKNNPVLAIFFKEVLQ